jgi:hypothetical protein
VEETDPVKAVSFSVKPTVCRMSDFAPFLNGLGTESIIGSNIGKVTSALSQKLQDRADKRSQNEDSATGVDTIRRNGLQIHGAGKSKRYHKCPRMKRSLTSGPNLGRDQLLGACHVNRRRGDR